MSAKWQCSSCSRPPRYYSGPYICRHCIQECQTIGFFCRTPKPSWYQSLLRACVHAFSSLRPLISAGIYHSESHRSLDGGNESLLSNICRIAAAKEVNLLLHNLLPVISPRALIKHQASTLADLLSKAIWWSSNCLWTTESLKRATAVGHLFVLSGTIKKCQIISLTFSPSTFNVDFGDPHNRNKLWHLY